MNDVQFHIESDPKTTEISYISALITVPSGREFGVTYHVCVDRAGQRSGLSIFPEDLGEDDRPLWIEDRDADDSFCSEMFAELTGRYPYEIEEAMTPNEDYVGFPG